MLFDRIETLPNLRPLGLKCDAMSALDIDKRPALCSLVTSISTFLHAGTVVPKGLSPRNLSLFCYPHYVVWTAQSWLSLFELSSLESLAVNSEDPGCLLELGIPPTVSRLELDGRSKPNARRKAVLNVLMGAENLRTMITWRSNLGWIVLFEELRAVHTDMQVSLLG